MRIRIDHAGGGAHALQADGFPHDDLLVVDAGRHDDQVAWLRKVDCRLNRLSRSKTSRSLTADCNRDGIDRFLAGTRGDDQFAAASPADTTVLCLLLDRAERYEVTTVVGQSDCNAGVTPTGYISADSTDCDTAGT